MVAAMWLRTSAVAALIGLIVVAIAVPIQGRAQTDDERAIRAVVDTEDATGVKDQEAVRIYGTTALVFYRSTVAGDVSSARRVTTVLVKRDGRWQAVSQQSSRIRPAATVAEYANVHTLLEADGAPAPADAEQQVRQVEQEIADATAKTDTVALERLWAPEFLWIGPIGQILTRADRLNAMRSGSETSQHYSIDRETVHLYGATAVVTFRSTVAGTIAGKDVTSQRTVTNVLVKSAGRWQAVVQHSTLIEPR